MSARLTGGNGRDRLDRASRQVTLVITNLTKLAGLVAFFWEMASTNLHPETKVLFVCAFMISGGQFSEGLLIGFFDHFFGMSQFEDDKEAVGRRREAGDDDR